MLQPGGYAVVVDPEGPTIERDTFTCVHCGGIVIVKPAQSLSDFDWCRRCLKPVCGKPACVARCLPWERQMEIMEGRARLHAAMDRALR